MATKGSDMHQGVKCCIEGLALNPCQASMTPTPVDPAAAVKLWLKAADSGQASEHWGRVQRTAWVAACFRSLKAAMIAKVHGFIYSHLCCWTEAARKCLDGKDSDLLAVIQFLFRDFDPSALPSATCLHVKHRVCDFLGASLPDSWVPAAPRQPWLPTWYIELGVEFRPLRGSLGHSNKFASFSKPLDDIAAPFLAIFWGIVTLKHCQQPWKGILLHIILRNIIPV